MDSFNRQACFNELSFLDKKEANEDVFQLFSDYVKTIKALKAKGFSGIRYELGIASLSMDGVRNVFELEKTSRGKDLFLFILSTARNPYISPGTQVKDIKNEDFEVLVKEEWCVGQGFTAAYLLDTIVVSLCTDSKWNAASYVIRRSDEAEQGCVLNVTTPEAIETDAINQFITERRPLELKTCQVQPVYKSCKLRDDHGKDKLMLLWNKLRNCEYIISAINSLEFKPSGRTFVETCFDNGIIHIRMVNSDAGYGMVIQTTGRTMRETEAIGEIIMQKYS